MTKRSEKKIDFAHHGIQKCPTGINGFDQVTEGGLPKKKFCLNMSLWTAKKFRRATLILKVSSSAWSMPLNQSAPNAL